MCILFLHTNPEPKDGDYRLIVATNRDEYYNRPAKQAFRCPETDIIAGRDMEPGREGGTWLGFKSKTYPENGGSTKHCFSCLTNLSGGDRVDHATGRGRLVIDYLEGSADYPRFLNELRSSGMHFNGYNLIGVELSKDGGTTTYHHSNYPQVDSIYRGQHTLSFGNSIISAPLMKVVHGKEKFLEIVGKGLKKDELKEELVALLKDRTKYVPDFELARRGPEAVDKLSSIYVDFAEAGYGTRTHTIVLIDKEWNMDFTEITMQEPIDPEHPKWVTTTIKSQL